MRALLFLFLCLFGIAGHADELRNELLGHPSPYLAMHGHDPVHWQQWNADTLARARREHKPLFVSIGYFACHWCHVMQRESYRDPAIAALLNRYFIPVKVDRELQPALDATMIEFVERTRGYSGWPLNVFLTPKGYPLLGMVYLPPDDFRRLLDGLQERWQQEPDALEQTAERVASTLSRGELSPGPNLPGQLAPQLSDALIKSSLELGDQLAGGFGGPNKFPQAPQLAALLQMLDRDSSGKLAAFLRLTLDQMASQGLRDHLRGGFFRYTIDPNWQTPHFEKMLYDNALLAEVYLTAAERLHEPRYRDVALDTLQFMLAELTDPSGAMIASLSAVDEQGVEGGFYLWSPTDLERSLTAPERAVVAKLWGLGAGAPMLETGYLPVQAAAVDQVAQSLNLERAQVEALRSSAIAKLRAVQSQRSLPRDTKLLAGWNGLALRAFSHAAQATGAPRYRAAAQRIYDYLVAQLWNGNRLLRARSGAGSLGDATLEDYAYVAAGLQAWADVADSERARALSDQVLQQAWQRFHQPRGWRLSEDLLIPYGVYEPVIADGPMPSPSSLLIDVTLRSAAARRDQGLERQARSALNVDRQSIRDDPFWFATQIRALRRAQPN